jgi:hypothetical protein
MPLDLKLKIPDGIRNLCYKNGVEVDAFGFKIKN